MPIVEIDEEFDWDKPESYFAWLIEACIKVPERLEGSEYGQPWYIPSPPSSTRPR